MSQPDKHHKLDERNHMELPLLEQLDGLGWEVLDLTAKKQQPPPQKFKPRAHPLGKEVVNGESALYLGRGYKIELVDSRERIIRFEQKFIIPKWLGAGQRTVLREWYQQRAEEKILPRVKRLAQRMGVEYANARLVDNLYRWGSCTPKNNLHLNWRVKQCRGACEKALVRCPNSQIPANFLHVRRHHRRFRPFPHSFSRHGLAG